MGCNHLLYFLLATVLHSKQYCTEERLNKKRLLYIQNTIVYIKMESHDLSQEHNTLQLECSFGIETLFLFQDVS